MSALATSIVLAISLILIVLWKSHKTHSTSKDPAICRQIITGVLKSTENQPNILSPHEAKAIANRHLPIAFGIDNAFTRADSVHASIFVNKVKPLINLSAEQWHNVSEFARVTTSHWIEHGFPDLGTSCGNSSHKEQNKSRNKINRINIASLAQILSLKVVLWQIFDQKTQDQTSDESLLNLAQSINRVWISSKVKTADNDIPKFEDDILLQTSLENIFGKHDRPEDNPLNLILPSFETMWRVVLRAFLEIKFASGREIHAWQQTMIAFASKPTKSQFDTCPESPFSCSKSKYSTGLGITDACGVQSAPSAHSIVRESLRLYVPTRHVHRAYQWDQGAPYETYSADIEGCHLRSDIWGSDAERFDPSRWSALTPAQGNAFMPFGCAPFECPAKPTFGPRMIGVLVGSLLAALKEDPSRNWSLDCEDGRALEGITPGKRLCPHRTSYTDLYLVRSL
ncbi:hypothetical protein N7517_008321 [Penicillium concentricum]|uniref:Cytochrome P450 n=1 Tax=Penicillium concentricum TaxID=293559 RepID=A0A9W9RS81_9EURO|nr:uncharacterized protein N7517_008321 [Penicillium concentricum]KAJ5365435.1 hypothetical protein N7517_008321 [Penicillium concentricum]